VRRLLLIAYHFPPEPSAGALRPSYLAKYLPQFGWDASVLTRSLPERRAVPYKTIEARVIGESFERSVRGAFDTNESPSRPSDPPPLRRVLRWVKKTLFFPDRVAGWIPHALLQALRATREDRYDAVLSTAMPASVHVVGAIVSAIRGLPWIADYRDPWTGNQYVEWGPIQTRLQRWLEVSLIRRASVVTTISQPIASLLESIHRRPVAVIPNGADPDDWSGLENCTPQRFSLCYTGSMYDGYRTPQLLFEALAELNAEGDPAANVHVDFYGPNSDHVGELARRYGLDANVSQHGTVPRREALAAQRRASHLLIFLNMDSSTSHELGSKVFEYAGAGRRILSFGPKDSVMRDYVAQRGLGWFASNVSEAKTALRSAYTSWQLGPSELSPPRGALFEARDLASAFADILDRISQSSDGLSLDEIVERRLVARYDR